MVQKFLLILVMSMLMVSCGGDDVDTTTDTPLETGSKKGLTPFENNDFSIGIPAAWEVINNTGELLPKPNNGNIALAASSPDVQNGFSNNILILSQKLNKKTTSKDFSILNHIGVEKEYSEYIKLDVSDVIFSSQDVSNIYTFEARYNIDSPKLKFIQTAAVCDDTMGYLITIALPVSIKDTSRYNSILGTFNCK